MTDTFTMLSNESQFKKSKTLFVMEMSSHAPDIRFNTIQETAGMETIKRVRQEGIYKGVIG